MYCVDDTTVISVGGMTSLGKMSPVNLLATTITDELRLYTYDRPKSSVFMKDRGAIFLPVTIRMLLIGLMQTVAHFMTSSYYMKRFATLVKGF